MNVYQLYGNEFRLGSILKEKADESGWKFFKIQWVNDERYEKANDWKEHLRNLSKGSLHKEWYRCDEVSLFDALELQGKLDSLLSECH